MKSSMVPRQAQQLKKEAQGVLETREQDEKEVPQNLEDPEAKVLIGCSIPEQNEQEIMKFLKDKSKTFAWKHEDMTCIEKNIVTRNLTLILLSDQYTKKNEGSLHLREIRSSKKN